LNGDSWEHWELEILQKNYEKMKTQGIVSKYLPHRTVDAVQHKARKLNLKRQTAWEDWEKEMILDNHKKLPMRNIQRLLLPHRTRGAVYAMTERLGIKLREEDRWGDFVEKEFPQTVWAYLAGIIDGEGTITILFTKRRNFCMIPLLSIFNLNQALMEWISNTLQLYCVERKKISGFGAPGGFMASTTCYPRVRWILKNILPYLVVKRKHAETVLRFIESRAQSGYGAHYTQNDLNYILEMRTLNIRSGKRLNQHVNSLKQRFEEYIRCTT